MAAASGWIGGIHVLAVRLADRPPKFRAVPLEDV